MDAEMARTETPAPGWYPDPDHAESIRYWNGTAWTDKHITPRDPGPRTITDLTFIAAANQVCKQQLTPLVHADRPQVGDTNKSVADRTEVAATGLDHLIASLRQIPVQLADQAHVDGWLGAWTTYATTGHQVAAAIRTSDPSKYEPLLEQGRKQRFPVVDFAAANGIKSCTF
jgi:hypothetical protein